MATDPRLAQSFTAALPRVLGFQLLPYSLAHLRTLDLLGSPFAGTGHKRPMDFAELALAVQVCNRPAPAFGQRLFTCRQGRLGYFERLFLAWRGMRHTAEQRQVFLDYLESANAGPVVWETDDAVPSKLPIWFALFTRLRAASMSAAEAWATPPGLAAWLCAGTDEAAGHIPNIMSESERAALIASGYDV